MDSFTKLISAIAQLLWPFLGFSFLWLFRAEIAAILMRLSHLKKFKGLGIDIELDKLEKSTEKAVQEIIIPQIPLPKRPTTRLARVTAARDEDIDILRDAAQSPKAALLLVGLDIDKHLRRLLAATGWQQNIKPEPLSDAIDKLRKQGSLEQPVSDSLKLFLSVRNKIVHGGQATDGEIFRAIDSGLSLLHAINSIPAEVNVVHQIGVPLYSDPDCTRLVTDATGIILETTPPDSIQISYRIFPTTRTHFTKGKRVAWEWNRDKHWGPTWYRDLNTNEIKEAWRASLEFVGRHLDDL